MNTINKLKYKQKGAALAIGMMLLLIVSVIGITSMKSALLQEKMAAGLKNRELADAAALTLLAAGERYLHVYYKDGNNTLLAPGIGPVVEPRTTLTRNFKSQRNLTDGFTHPLGISLVSIFAGALAEEPKYLIEDIQSAPISVEGSIGGANTNYQATVGESGGASSGSNSGTNADSGSGSGTGGFEIRKYRVVSKATDSTGHLYSGFESLVSVKTR